MVDKALILRKLTELEEHLKQIKEFSNITVEDYSREWKTQRIVERTLQIMIEICADIANHIIADKGYRVPKSYADTFRVLYEKDIIEEEIFKMMENMAKFRNVVVHRYDKLDEYIVINILKKHLNDFLVYRNVILDTFSQN
ncbi:MAG: hypothetical protein A2106_06015 [Planctomycetes bacterium GWF2_40_8]|nr:MAG: hypothetical protein A2106_06015 [Planctomycetes bacterium GWF2_40_8]OHB86809.1 MAG: hypothetical protein A3D13_09780 [Planctomycetes bacterium RIFCSPHIGHO2_02_FULL_40_12]OHC02576.1 MAG: hypothetical protein A3H23_06605 [Planctomycetes bacterium RIFCSPLOWO2_12_FULL_40_19]